jgi:hypothetical protein
MAQPIHVSINLSPTYFIAAIAAVAVSQIIREYATLDINRVKHNNSILVMVNTVYAAAKNLVLDSPVIALVTGLTYAVHQLTPHAPVLALSSDAMKAASFVGELFVLKSVLTPFLEKVTESETSEVLERSTSGVHSKNIPGECLLRNSLVLHFFPLALGTLYAYYASVPVKLAQSALYTASLVGVVKLLGAGIGSICKIDAVRETIMNWYFG